MSIRKCGIISYVFLFATMFTVSAESNGTASTLSGTTQGYQLSMQNSDDYNTQGRNSDSGLLTKEVRKNSVSLSIPWNGIAGLGLLYTYRPSALFAIDGGVGLSGMGLKAGIRGRYCFNRANATPFAGIGLMSGSGGEGIEVDIDGTKVTYDLNSINFLQLTGGLDFVAKNGFTCIISTGWAIPFNDGVQDVQYDGQSAESYYDQKVVDTFNTTADLLYRGGFVLELIFGFAF